MHYQNVTPNEADRNPQTKFVWLAKAWIFGDKIQHDGFCNGVVSTIAAIMEDESVEIATILRLNQSSSSNPIRQQVHHCG